MSKKIYIGNLSWNITENILTNLFTQYGEVISANIITNHKTKRSKGFGFVEMEDVNAAETAIFAYDGRDFDGRKIRVREALNRIMNQSPKGLF